MEKRNKIALENLIKELEALSTKEDLDTLGNNIVEPHQVSSILESFKMCLGDAEFEVLKKEIVVAATPEEEESLPNEKAKTKKGASKDAEGAEGEGEGEGEGEEVVVKEADTKAVELESNIDLKKFLEVVKDKMDLLVTEQETMLALKTLTQFKKDTISLVELR